MADKSDKNSEGLRKEMYVQSIALLKKLVELYSEHISSGVASPNTIRLLQEDIERILKKAEENSKNSSKNTKETLNKMLKEIRESFVKNTAVAPATPPANAAAPANAATPPANSAAPPSSPAPPAPANSAAPPANAAPAAPPEKNFKGLMNRLANTSKKTKKADAKASAKAATVAKAQTRFDEYSRVAVSARTKLKEATDNARIPEATIATLKQRLADSKLAKERIAIKQEIKQQEAAAVEILRVKKQATKEADLAEIRLKEATKMLQSAKQSGGRSLRKTRRI